MRDTCCLESMSVWIQEEIKPILGQGGEGVSFSSDGYEWRDSEGVIMSVRQGGTKDIWLGLVSRPLQVFIFYLL